MVASCNRSIERGSGGVHVVGSLLVDNNDEKSPAHPVTVVNNESQDRSVKWKSGFIGGTDKSCGR